MNDIQNEYHHTVTLCRRITTTTTATATTATDKVTVVNRIMKIDSSPPPLLAAPSTIQCHLSLSNKATISRLLHHESGNRFGGASKRTAVVATTTTQTRRGLCSWKQLTLVIGLSGPIIALLLANQTDGQLIGGLVGGITGGIAGITGRVMKSFVYGTKSLLEFNNNLICPLSVFDSLKPPEEPKWYVFARPEKPDKAMIIYADEDLTDELFAETELRRDRKTVFVLHGFMGSVESLYWPLAAKDTILKSVNSSQHQVILINWPKSAMGTLYQVFNNNFVIAKRLAKMFRWLKQSGNMDPSEWHCLGHSYGAHICGIASREAFGPRTMGRITSLDTGGFCYELGHEDTQNYYGLRPTDAKQVDAFVTNTSPFGNRHNIAQFNVRVGDGRYQPEQCSVWRSQSLAKQYFIAIIKWLFYVRDDSETIACEHYFSTRFAFQQLEEEQQCQYVAYLCDSYQSFVRGRCGICGYETGSSGVPNQCYVMDFEYQQPSEEARTMLQHQRTEIERLYDSTSMEKRLYYMLPSKEEPYCEHVYHVRLILKMELKGSPEIFVTFTLEDDQGNRNETVSSQLFGPWPEHMDIMTAVLNGPEVQSMPNFVRAKIEDKKSIGLKLQHIESIEISYMSSVVKEIKKRRGRILLEDRITIV